MKENVRSSIRTTELVVLQALSRAYSSRDESADGKLNFVSTYDIEIFRDRLARGRHLMSLAGLRWDQCSAISTAVQSILLAEKPSIGWAPISDEVMSGVLNAINAQAA